jgi:hypothetical protein
VIGTYWNYVIIQNYRSKSLLVLQLKARAQKKNMKLSKDIEGAKCIKAQTSKLLSNCETKSIRNLNRLAQFRHLFEVFCQRVKEFNDPHGGTCDMM